MTLPQIAACPHPCTWHSYPKHHPFVGMQREDTVRGPARYLKRGSIRAIETTTVRAATHALGKAHEGRTEYARDVGDVIGYESGEEARWSYVECSGAIGSSIAPGARSFHGHPVGPKRLAMLALPEART